VIRIEVVRSAWESDGRMQFATAPTGDTRLIRAPAILTEAGTPVAAVLDLRTAAPTVAAVRAGLGTVDWGDGESRLAGWNNPNRTFGTSPPSPLRRRYGCSESSFARDEPVTDRALARLATVAAEQFGAWLPDQEAHHQELVRGAIHADWFLGGSAWTSGIINRTAVLPYHRDAGNIKGAWSAMVTLRRGVNGGYLHMPEWGVTLATTDLTLTIFDGQNSWHGVTPIELVRPDAYRYTIVYYTKRGCVSCGERSGEAARAQLARTEAEDRMANR